MTSTTTSPSSITPAALVARLADGERVTVLDVRDDAAWPIEAPGLTVRHVPTAQVLADPARVAAELEGPVVVVCHRGLSAQGVVDVLRATGTQAAVLEGGMRGWIGALRAVPVELGLRGLRVLQVQRPGRGCLSYVLSAGGRALVVDPAPDAAFYADLAEGLGVTITDVLDTHLHADHLSGARELAELTGASLRLPAPALQRGVTYPVLPLAHGDRIPLGDIDVHAVALPGHTTDMTGLAIGSPVRALLSGDSLFADGIARPDLQEGDPEGARAMGRMLHDTLHERVLALDDDVVLLPGHDHPRVRTAAVAPTLGQVRARVPELAIGDPAEFAEALLADMPARPANYEAVIAVNAGAHEYDPELETGGNSCSTR